MKKVFNEKWLIPLFISLAILRYLPNFIDANLYAEDGTVFLANYISSGFASFNNLFNGYPIFGLYLLTGIASMTQAISSLPGYTLPTFIAITSFAYWGLLSYSPIYFFRGVIERKNRIIFAFAILFIPLGSSDYAILGTIGNLKFSFLPLSFFIAVKLHRNEEISNRELSLNYILLACCILTNPLSILSLFVLVPLFFHSISRHNWIQIFWFHVIFISSLIPIFSHLKNSSKTVGYLDSPFQLGKAIEIFAGQTILYAPVHSIYTYLNDYSALSIASLIVLFILWQSKRGVYLPLFALAIAICGSVVFVVQRPGVSEYFFGYTLSSPSQFFYSQNILIMTAIFLAIEKVNFRGNETDQNRSRFIFSLALFISLIFPTTPIGSFGINPLMQSQVKSAVESAREVCLGDSVALNVPIYPTTDWVFTTTREFWCF